MSDWIREEFEAVNLGDKRLNQRLTRLAEGFFMSPETSINQMCDDWSDTKAAYRFFQNEKVDYKEIVKSHATKTRDRARSEELILAVQDTSYLNYSKHPKTKDLGVISSAKGQGTIQKRIMGICMHTTLALSQDGLPLGILDQQIYARKETPLEMKNLKEISHQSSLPFEERESFRWVESLKKSVAQLDPQKVVTIADREGDIYGLFHLAKDLNTHFLVRSCQNRVVNKLSIHSKTSGEHLWEVLRNEPPEGKIQVKVPKKEGQEERNAMCHIQFKMTKLLSPQRYTGKYHDDVGFELYGIRVFEKNPPKNEPGIQWILLTNMPVVKLSDALEKIRWYCLRWRIETFHKTLKSGFKVEDCRLNQADRLIRYLSVMSVVAWRVLWLTLVARVVPEMPSRLLLNDFDWKILFAKFNPNEKLPSRPPPIKSIVSWIARLGGHLNRKNDPEPGIIYVWRGLKKLNAMIEGAQTLAKLMGNS